MARTEALERYRELPLPDTTQEHWRFTDLKDFDPDSFDARARELLETRLDPDIASAIVHETGLTQT